MKAVDGATVPPFDDAAILDGPGLHEFPAAALEWTTPFSVYVTSTAEIQMGLLAMAAGIALIHFFDEALLDIRWSR